MKLEFFIPGLPKLPNRLLGAPWRTRSSNAAKWKRFIGTALLQFRPFEPLAFAHLTLTRCSPRSCDFDGLVGSFKPVIDGLVKHGLLEDDTIAHIETEYIWEKVGRKEQGVKIKVESREWK